MSRKKLTIEERRANIARAAENLRKAQSIERDATYTMWKAEQALRDVFLKGDIGIDAGGKLSVALDRLSEALALELNREVPS